MERHAAAIRSILENDPKSFEGNDMLDANGLDRAFEPAMVLNAASTFILNKINASNCQHLKILRLKVMIIFQLLEMYSIQPEKLDTFSY